MSASLRQSANRMLTRLSGSLTAELMSSQRQSLSKSLTSSATTGTNKKNTKRLSGSLTAELMSSQRQPSKSLTSSVTTDKKKSTKRSASWGILRLSSSVTKRQDESNNSSSRTSHNSTGCSSTAAEEPASSIISASAWDDTAQREFRHSIIELPGTANFASNHVLINQERIRQGKAPLDRSRELDDLARSRAETMAQRGTVFALEERIHSSTMAENAQKGSSIRFIHQMIVGGVSSDGERETMLNDQYIKFGVGCATGEDGMIYMSQIFEAPPEEEEELPEPRSSFFQKLPKSRLPGRKSMLKPLAYLQKKTKRTRRRNNLHYSQ